MKDGKEVVEMIQTLLEMQYNTYMKCKCILLVVSRDSENLYNFMQLLFELVERHRPLLIEMK